MGKTSVAITDSSDGPVPAPAVPTNELADTTIHLTLQGKGGVGKSLVAVILAQYLSQRGLQIQCIDTDPLNRTFAQYEALGAERIQVRDEHKRKSISARLTGCLSAFSPNTEPPSWWIMAPRHSCHYGTIYWKTGPWNTVSFR